VEPELEEEEGDSKDEELSVEQQLLLALGSEEKYEAFRQWSAQLLQQEMTSEEYYELLTNHLKSLSFKKKTKLIEGVVKLIPDWAKGISGELNEIHRKKSLEVRQEEAVQRRRNQSQEEAENQSKAQSKEGQIGERVKSWKKRYNGEIIKLLSNLSEIFPAENYFQSGNTPNEEQVRHAYHAAIKLVHPDRHAASSVERRVCANAVFQVLNKSFKKYEKNLQK